METLKKRVEFGEPKFAYIWQSTDFIGTLARPCHPSTLLKWPTK